MGHHSDGTVIAKIAITGNGSGQIVGYFGNILIGVVTVKPILGQRADFGPKHLRPQLLEIPSFDAKVILQLGWVESMGIGSRYTTGNKNDLLGRISCLVRPAHQSTIARFDR